ncbi:MAG: hypothetical protein ACLR23_18630 [Clostridia bacterium]|jgi:hypothetical protein|uniref:Uncharacterized protein n=1 Tax=Bianquea renquensis TaxID=2763661 RepID=A0A926DV53_9FIRM|nr:hypothetical protein [Bianquea renquensis]MBC8543959.1 hypothetical protein [Bianquea renquensis]
MHAGEASKSSGQRAHGDKFLHVTVETTMPASRLPNICRGRTILFPTAPLIPPFSVLELEKAEEISDCD